MSEQNAFSGSISQLELGRLIAQIEHLQQSLDEHKEASRLAQAELKEMINTQNRSIERQQVEIAQLRQLADRGYGALAVVLVIGSAIGSLITWIVDKVR